MREESLIAFGIREQRDHQNLLFGWSEIEKWNVGKDYSCIITSSFSPKISLI